MTFTKKKLAAAITGTLLASVGAQNASAAAIVLDDAAQTGLVYANEMVLAAAGTDITDGGDDQDMQGLLATNVIAADTDVRVTLTLSSGTFAAAPSMSVVTAALAVSACVSTNAAAITCPTPTVFSGGTTADSTVVFDMDTGAITAAANSHFLIAMAGIKMTAQAPVTATVGIQIADRFGPTSLPTVAGPLLSFSPASALAANANTIKAIDVVQNSLYFAETTGATGTRSENVGGYSMTFTAAPKGVTTNTLDLQDITASAQATVTAANGFSAFNQGTTGGTIGQIAGTGTFSTSDATVATMVAYVPGVASDNATVHDITLTAPTGNTVPIAETTLVATIAATAASAAYSAANVNGSIALASLARNGSSARLTFATNPDSAYPMSLRITNPSSVAGPVTLTLTNDSGVTSASIPITAISGGPAGDLGAGASTGLLSIADVFAAVQAADATFDLGTTNKLRVAVVAEFGGGANTDVVLNAFSLSSDGTTFSMVTDSGA
jgi:hypothetical protein